jgi:prevent-host-death family protein
MDVSLSDAKDRLPELIQAVEGGESVIITQDGKPVAQLTAPAPRTKIRLGSMVGRMELRPGWDDPIDLDEFLAGDI